MVLNAIYEGDFVGFSYGFRPGRGPHDALDALSTAIKIRKVNWILDADIRNFFGAVSQDWLVRFLDCLMSQAIETPPCRSSCLKTPASPFGVFTFRACAAYSPATARRAPIVRAAS